MGYYMDYYMEPRIIVTPCCKYSQSTRQPKGTVIRCTKCTKPFTESKK